MYSKAIGRDIGAEVLGLSAGMIVARAAAQTMALAPIPPQQIPAIGRLFRAFVGMVGRGVCGRIGGSDGQFNRRDRPHRGEVR
jgi:hypothetical protein